MTAVALPLAPAGEEREQCYGSDLRRWLGPLRRHRWPERATFKARLVFLERIVQEQLDRLPNLTREPRVAISTRLTLDELALILPPTEQRLLAHLRARRPLRGLDGTPGFHTISRRNERIQRLLGRIQVYCGSTVRHRLAAPYDRPGHAHRLRPGNRRVITSAADFPPLRFWVPRAYAWANGWRVTDRPASREVRPAQRRWLRR